jgi:hypothetical protein
VKLKLGANDFFSQRLVVSELFGYTIKIWDKSFSTKGAGRVFGKNMIKNHL